MSNRQRCSGTGIVATDQEHQSRVIQSPRARFRRANPFATFHDWRRRRKFQQQSVHYRKPSVALANYEILDTRSSTMSSLLLLFAIFEGMCGFALPICSAFSRPESSVKRYYYEDFLLFQYGLSILALLYLQALIFYYDHKENFRRKCYFLFIKMSQPDQVIDELGNDQINKSADRVEQGNTADQQTNLAEDYNAENPQAENTAGAVWVHPNVTRQSLRSSFNHYNSDQMLSVREGMLTTDADNSIDVSGIPGVVPPSIHISPADSCESDRVGDLTARSSPSLRPSQAYSRTQFERMGVYGSKVSFTGDNVTAPNGYNRISSEKAPMPVDTDSSESSSTEEHIPANDQGINPVTDLSSRARPSKDNKKMSKSSSLIEHLGLDRQHLRHKSMLPIQFLFGDTYETKHSWYFSRDSEGINLYLRLGAVGFGFGVMIFDGFKIAGHWETTSNEQGKCHGTLWIPIHLVHFIYVFWQTYFLFKHHQVVFNVQKFVLRFLLCHLAVANLCQWLKTIVDEISNEPAHSGTPHSPETTSADNINLHAPESSHMSTLSRLLDNATNHITVNGSTADAPITHGSCRTTEKYLAPYLFPCAIEYSLIAGAIFYKMFQKVGHVQQESERLQRLRQANTMTGGFAECHRSHKGLFIGLLIFMATLVTMSLFFIFFDSNDRRTTAITLYQCTELILLALGVLTCLATMYRLRILKFSQLSEEGAFDDNLLLIGLIGMIFYDLFLLVPALEAFHTDQVAARLFAAKAFTEIIQSLLQVLLILEASRRCAGTMSHVKDKPGRTLITLLLILNLAMWFVNTFEVKRADNHSIHINYYTGMAWKIITHIALPLIVFFRFHSTVCLSDIWANAYRFRTE